jgi:hypothetical protein
MCGIAGFWQTKRQGEIPAEILIRVGTRSRSSDFSHQHKMLFYVNVF